MNNLVTTHHLHQKWIGAGHTYIQFQKKVPKIHLLMRPLEALQKTCTLNFKGQKDVFGEVKYQKEANLWGFFEINKQTNFLVLFKNTQSRVANFSRRSMTRPL